MYTYHKQILLVFDGNDYTNYTSDQLVTKEFEERINFYKF